MSNQANIVTCTFVDRVGGEVTHGYRMYDAYAMTYGNIWEHELSDPLEILQKIYSEADETERGIFDGVIKEKRGITIDFKYLEWDFIKDVFENDDAEEEQNNEET